MTTDRALAPAFGIGVHPLPVGHHTLEASAGTGKTHAIVGLATRYLAEGRCTAEELLVVTFSRSASRELRGRLLTRLSTSVDLLDAALAGRPLPDHIDDEDLHDALASDKHGDPAARLARLRTALADIDHASIATIHGFCDDLLRRLGDPALGTLLEDEGALATQIMGDVYVRMARHEPRLGDDLPYAPMKALPIIRAGMQHPRSALLPAASFDDEGGAKVWMAIAAGVEATKRNLLEFLIEQNRAGKQVVAYGAPGKGNTLLNYCGIREDFLAYAVDRSTHKHGRFTPGTHIPIHDVDKLAETKPDYVVILPWNLKKEIAEQLAYTAEWGAKLVVPIPELEVFEP